MIMKTFSKSLVRAIDSVFSTHGNGLRPRRKSMSVKQVAYVCKEIAVLVVQINIIDNNYDKENLMGRTNRI